MVLRIDIVILSDADFYPPTINAANILAEKGHKVRLIDIRYPSVKRQQLNPAVTRIHYGRHRRKLGNILQYFSFYAWYMWLLRKDKPDWIIAYDAMAVGPVSMAAGLHKIKWLYHNHDLLTNASGWYKFIQWTDVKLARKARVVCFPQEDRAAGFMQSAKLKTFPVIVYNGPRKNWSATQLPIHWQLRDWHAAGNFIILYQGQFSKYFNLEVLLQAMPLLPANFVLCIIGRPLEPDIIAKYQQQIEDNNLQHRVRMPEPLTYDEIPSITAYAHLGVAKLGMDSSIPLNDFFLTGASNKISEYLAFGLPILMADTEVNRNFYTKYGFAVFADGTRPDSVAAAIKAAAIAGTYEQLRNCARKAGSDVFNYDTQFNKIVSIVEES